MILCFIYKNKTNTLQLQDIFTKIPAESWQTPSFKRLDKTVKQELLEKGLISRHKDKNGRSFNIKTTPKFAEYFKLKGDVRALVKTLNIDKGVKDDEG